MAVQYNFQLTIEQLASLFAASEKRRPGADGPHARKARRPHRKRTSGTLRMRTPKADAAGGPSPPAHPSRGGGAFGLRIGRAWRPKGGWGPGAGARTRWRGRARTRSSAPRPRRGLGPAWVRSRWAGLIWTGVTHSQPSEFLSAQYRPASEEDAAIWAIWPIRKAPRRAILFHRPSKWVL